MAVNQEPDPSSTSESASRADVAGIVGTPLREGQFTIRAWEHWLFCEAIGARPSYNEIHPVYAFIACVKGSGTDLNSLLAMVNASVEDGPMLGTNMIELAAPLRSGQNYLVKGRITAYERKTGAKLGAFDLMSVTYQLVRDSTVTARVENRYVIPRMSRT